MVLHSVHIRCLLIVFVEDVALVAVKFYRNEGKL